MGETELADAGIQLASHLLVWLSAIAVFAIVALSTYVAFSASWVWLADSFRKQWKLRAGLFGLSIAFTALSAIAVECVGFADIRAGRIHNDDVLWLLGAVVLATFACAIQIALGLLADRTNSEIDELRNALVKRSDELRIALDGKTMAAENAKREIERRAEAIRFMHAVSSLFIEVDADKFEAAKDLSRKLAKAGQSLELSDLRKHLDPREQMAALLHAVFRVFEKRLEDEPEVGLRIAYFQAIDGHLTLVHCWDRSRSVECVTTPNDKHRTRFSLWGGESLAVSVARKGKREIVPDASVAHANDDHAFFHFDGKQMLQIKSIVAIPLGPENANCSHVVCLDCDQKDFFGRFGTDRIAFIFQNLAKRLLFEAAMDKVLPTNTLEAS